MEQKIWIDLGSEIHTPYLLLAEQRLLSFPKNLNEVESLQKNPERIYTVKTFIKTIFLFVVGTQSTLPNRDRAGPGPAARDAIPEPGHCCTKVQETRRGRSRIRA